MITTINQDVVRKFFDDCWNQGDVSQLASLMASDHVHHLPGRELHGSDEVGNLILYLRAALPDLHITVDDVIVCGDKIVCRWTLCGTNTGPFGGSAATGRSVKYTGIDIIRCRGGQIAELWGEYDSRGLDWQLQQPEL